MKTITTDELRQRLAAGPVALFDVRGDLEFEQAHIPDAMSAPLGSLSFRVAGIMNPDSFVVVYSAGPDCHLASEAAKRLGDLRLQNVHVYEAGVEGWLKAGLLLVPSPNPRSEARGPVVDCRPLVVDRERAYGGAFKGPPDDGEGAGG
jgi:rhodanese-related sulfurtransferase